MLQKVKFNKYFQEFTTYNENYELGLINDRILLEIAVAQDAFKTISMRSSTKILDFIGDIGGFYGSVDLFIFLIAEYFSAKFLMQSVSNSMFIRKKTSSEIDQILNQKNEEEKAIEEED